MAIPKPTITLGKTFSDQRGKIEFFNNFDFSPIKRIYFTKNKDTSIVRAWQGHKVEKRWFFCVKGGFQIKLVRINNWDNPSEVLPVHEFDLTSGDNQILYIPNGFVNGFKAKVDNSKLMVMSNYAFQELEEDQVRFDKNKWTQW